MSLLVVGSVALDTVETPFGTVKDALGGAAVYFSSAASYFSDVKLVGVVGEDFDDSLLSFLKKRNTDLRGVEKKPGKTFRWGGIYGSDLNSRETTFTHLNVFESFAPRIPDEYKDCEYVFLANIGPELQLDVLDQINQPKLVALDTMNYWIEGSLPALKEVLERVHVLVINDAEARQLSGQSNLLKAARVIFDMGPDLLIIKKGEHGALMIFKNLSFFYAPAYPLEILHDPTGAGDTFAGGFMGYLAQAGAISIEHYKRALIFGSTMAAFCVEQFSVKGLVDLTDEQIKARFNEFWKMTQFERA